MAAAAAASCSASSFDKEALLQSVGQGNWRDVIEIYKKYPESHSVQISRSRETAIHIAIANGSEQVVEGLVWLCGTKALEICNQDGDTPLHVAANVGTVQMCRCIATKHSNLIGWRNENGETPHFLAVSQGKMSTFLCLQRICEKEGCRHYACYRRNNGDTILHAAISGGHLELAFYIIHVYGKVLVDKVNADGMTALHLVASKPTAFESGIHLYFLRELLYRCLYISKLQQPDDDHVTSTISSNWFSSCFTNIIHHRPACNGRANHQHDEEANKQGLEPRILRAQKHHERCFSYFGMCLYLLGSSIFTSMTRAAKVISYISGYARYARFRNLKKRCVWSEQIMNELLQHNYQYEHEQYGMCPLENPPNDLTEYLRISATKYGMLSSENSGNDLTEYIPISAIENGMCPSENPPDDPSEFHKISTTKRATVLTIAAKNGVVEIVEKILDREPDAISDVDSEKKNIIMLAVENRHVPLYKFLLKDPTTIKTAFGHEDNDGNSVLHIAAKLGEDQRPWRIRGAALQMHMEVKWYKYVKHSMPPGFFVRYNKKQETPRQIFKETHEKLREEGRNWLNNNAQPCSVVAALIATVAFAASTTFPGGVKPDTGTPTLGNKPIFIVSAIASLVALCSSMVSVIMFLGILTSSMRKKDFRRDLPYELILGLISLLISVVSMLVSFFGGHHFVLKDELKHASVPVYALLCLPLVVFVIAKFPLDLWTIWATFKTEPMQRKLRAK